MILKNRKKKFVLIYFLTLKTKILRMLLITLYTLFTSYINKISINEKYNRSQLFSYYFL